MFKTVVQECEGLSDWLLENCLNLCDDDEKKAVLYSSLGRGYYSILLLNHSSDAEKLQEKAYDMLE